MRWFFSCVSFLFFASVAQSQGNHATLDATLPSAQVTQQEVYKFDIARPVIEFDATPDGSLWFAVEVFGTERSITINGVHRFVSYGDISPFSTRISPNGKYMIWAGITHIHDNRSLNTSVTSLFRHNAGSDHSDSITAVESDHGQVYFSPKGDHWAALLPASNTQQAAPRDLAVVDGKIVSSG